MVILTCLTGHLFYLHPLFQTVDGQAPRQEVTLWGLPASCTASPTGQEWERFCFYKAGFI